MSQLLASTTAPPMPEMTARRLHAAIADEAARRAAGSSVRTPGRPDLPKRRRRPPSRSRFRVFSSPLVLRGLAAAGVLVLLVGGGIVLANLRSTGGPSSTAASKPHSYSNPSFGVAPAGALASTRLRYRHGAEYVYTDAVTSSKNYTKADLPTIVRREAASAPNVAYPQSTMVPSNVQPTRQLNHTTVSQLESCLTTVATSDPSPVLLVEVARYLSQPATIIIFKPVKPVDSTFDVIVVGQACGPAGPDIITKLAVPTK